jgi:Flp pilus assembly pilin Flp
MQKTERQGGASLVEYALLLALLALAVAAALTWVGHRTAARISVLGEEVSRAGTTATQPGLSASSAVSTTIATGRSVQPSPSGVARSQQSAGIANRSAPTRQALQPKGSAQPSASQEKRSPIYLGIALGAFTLLVLALLLRPRFRRRL